MKVIGIDPGRVTGFAWRTPSGAWRCGQTHPANLMTILLEARLDGVDTVACEDCFLGRNATVFKILVAVQVHIACLCKQARLRVVLVPPLRWKSAMLSGSGFLPRGRDCQKQAALAVARRLGADPKTLDAADATCLAAYLEGVGEQQVLDLKAKRRTAPARAR